MNINNKANIKSIEWIQKLRILWKNPILENTHPYIYGYGDSESVPALVAPRSVSQQ